LESLGGLGLHQRKFLINKWNPWITKKNFN